MSAGQQTAETTGSADATGEEPAAEAEFREEPPPEKPPLGVCGVLDEKLGCGPCVLPLGHRGQPHKEDPRRDLRLVLGDTDASESRWPNK